MISSSRSMDSHWYVVRVQLLKLSLKVKWDETPVEKDVLTDGLSLALARKRLNTFLNWVAIADHH